MERASLSDKTTGCGFVVKADLTLASCPVRNGMHFYTTVVELPIWLSSLPSSRVGTLRKGPRTPSFPGLYERAAADQLPRLA